ncbi:MAG: hypothetical protein COZ06_28485 [Armatimonadetes bacterium CG_4_10_14_3_um_filter_66_18]|nr:zinc-binding dehydrogenase [Armatimonadota bacterium]OIO95418.1 MAG: hypothetical protein AUJ96_26695 [Armatimonadetes bacterium CG2_30_66_41]PIU91572.1 MAG: hypothetical protein COS65_21455 [Armatimonadetes bacterium CG06_land_8_20_14_3_00_66_21]PIX45733.1 MAG: hypothetical protein COZ57_14580 [Armatimonadetes bacterium CG_4_8_14_3_um_filter_66_20]PIY40131.1 MAG: hypothetical protein COZ06_28485 [Armatimonadetes bacterium CG_4_10_14_3_um_filter_66_18]PIZ48264.1 MAG: hypothetical protein CO
MKCLQIDGIETASVKDLPIPEPGPGQVLSKVLAVTTCPQWDLHIYYGRPMFGGESGVPFPYEAGQPGHEMTGVVEAVGEGVTDFAPGDRVSAWRDQGHNRQGCYAQYVVHEQDSLLKVPADLDPPGLAPLELAMCLSVSILDLKAMNALAGRDYAVSGLGPAGLVALQLLKAEGATKVVGLDPNPSRCEYAVMVGADRAIDPTGEAGQAIPERTAPGCFECAIDCVGYWDSVRYVMDHTREFVALFGVQRENYLYSGVQARGPGLKLCGYRGHYKEAAQYALDKIREGALDLSSLVTHKLPLEDYDHAVELLKAQEAVKVCFLPWE